MFDEERLIKDLKKRREDALCLAIDHFSAYVGTIIWNILGHTLDKSDMEEIIADVFYSLWQNADRVKPGKMKQYLAVIARNRAVDALRSHRAFEELEADYIEFSSYDPEKIMTQAEEAEMLRQAVDSLPEPDREIFLRHYYLYQSTRVISAETGINVNTVQTKLKRGREALRRELTKGGYFVE